MSGEMDLLSVATVTTEVTTVLHPPTTLVVFDLSQVRLLAAAGLTALLAIRDTAHSAGIEVRLAAPSKAARRSLTVTGLDVDFTVFGSVDTATAQFDVLTRVPAPRRR